MRSLTIFRYPTAIIFAILLGIMTGLPQLIAVKNMGSEFQGIYPVLNNDELYYLARAQEVVDGHGTIGQPYLFEGKNNPSPQFWFAEFIIGKTSALVGVSVHTMFTILDFIFPALAFILTYLIALSVARRSSLALLFAVVFHFGLYFEQFNRPISPQFNFIALQLFLLATLRWVEGVTRVRTVLLGAAFGLLFSTYAYYAIYASLLFAAAILVAVLSRDTVRFRGLVYAGLMALVLATPYIFQMIAGAETGQYSETMKRLGMIETHFPSGIFIVLISGLVLFTLCVFLYSRLITLTQRTVVLGMMVAVVPVATNLQIVTGKNIEFSSHYDVLAVFACLLLAVFLAESVTKKYWSDATQKKTAIILFLLLSLGSLAVSGNIAIAQCAATPELYASQRYAPLFRWVSVNTPQDEVFYANRTISSLLPSYTPANVYFARESNMHYASNREIELRYIASEYFSAHLDEATIRENERSLWGTYYINRRQHAAQANKLLSLIGFDVQEVEQYPKTDIARILAQIKKRQGQGFRDMIAPYRADYLIWDKLADPTWDPEQRVGGLKKIFEANEIVLYRL